MKKIKQINNWGIFQYTKKDYMSSIVLPEETYLVKSPDGRIMEDRLTLKKAEEFCNENLDFISKNSQNNV